MNPIITGIVAVVMVIMLGVAVTGFVGPEATSLIPKSCTFPGDVHVEMSGTFSVRDGQVIGIEPEIDQLESISITYRALSVAQRLASVEDFTVQVTAEDSKTGKKLGQYKSSGALSSSGFGSRTQEDFFIRYDVKDNDCNGIVDDHSLDLEIRIEEKEDFLFFESEDVETFNCNVVKGRISC